MNPFEFVIAIIAITTIGSIIRAKYLGPRRHRSRRGLMDRHGDFHGEERDTYADLLSEYFLRTEGYVVELALNAEDAERAFREHRPALAIIELLISGGAGAELSRRLKRTAPVPILAISSLAVHQRALAAGADAFLQKPLDPLQLVSAVKDLLGQSALTRSPAR